MLLFTLELGLGMSEPTDDVRQMASVILRKGGL